MSFSLGILASSQYIVTTPGTTYATFNPTYAGTGVTLSGGNLVATMAGSNAMVIATIGASTTGKSTGKWYWEITMTSSGGNRDMGVIGTLSPSSGLSSWVGNQSNGWGYYSTTGGFTGALFTNGALTNNYFNADYAAGDIIGFALNALANSLQIYKNGTPLIPAVTLSGGNYFPAVSSNSATYTANFGASAFTYTVPAAYTAGYF